MLQTILESAVAAILAIDDSGRIKIANPAAERMFGYTSDEMLGRNVSMLMPEPYRTQHDRYMERYLRTGEKRIIGIGREAEGQRKDGTIFPIHLAVGEFEMSDERFFSGIITDLSAHARLQAEIDRQSLLFQAVFDYVPETLVISAPEGQIVLINPAATRMFGYSASEATGLDWTALFDVPPDKKQLEKDLAGQQAGDGGSVAISTVLRRKDGRKFPAQGHIAVITGADQTQMAVVSLFRDMTEELKRRESSLRLQKLEAVGQLTGGIAHDFNNLLTIISGNLELLEGSISNAEDRELLSRATRAADSGARLTRRLLTFARRRQLAPEVINLNEQVRSMTELLHRTLGDTIDLQTSFARDLWLTRADAGEVEAAVINLAINARDAMPNGGKLSIRTNNAMLESDEVGFEGPLVAGDYVQISVSDNGIGMNRAVLTRVFEPFFTTKPPGRGTGLGLSTIYGFIKQSGGNITIYSEPGVGTTVNLYFPRCPDYSGAAASVADASKEERGSGERILVVEDNGDVRALTVQRLHRLGYEVVEFATGAAARDALKGGLEVDLVFSDIMMPGGLTGVDLGKWIGECRSALPVILTTGFADEATDIAAVADVWPILRKPYTQRDLAEVVRKTLEKRKV
ncbi:PAS/PAC sensor hybrid histidine kinase [Hyphomicrobium denitrificans 1NES1]|uniref:Sensor protein FixL n=1 Tax=Hyphomicrobium denitrificans 1NES1 TaxID=670307 RepID=N0B1I0_9HYPH|nr:PAS domain S-box protein [Hyphomicrobium denitrificans]AGK56813.1 PAS/PAC sensor hybrid histidine kinase [Hyphomicrobium denitrificans 1NES1]